MIQGEIALQEGKKEEAKKSFEEVLEKTRGGILAATASQYLAILLMQEGKHKEAYDLLLPIREHLADDTRCLLHQLAAEFANYGVVADLSAECYQTAPSQEMALRNARAFAFLKKGKMAGGWLKTAFSYGGIELEAILKESEFSNMKGNKEFEAFLEEIK
jgi:tetratricopeptide (TPR) repeat protein